MKNAWGMSYNEEGVVSTGSLYAVTDGSHVKSTPDAPYLAICVPTRGMIPIEVAIALKRIAIPINTNAAFMYLKGKMGTSSRDEMTQTALKIGADYIFYLDDDVIPPPDVLYKMMVDMVQDPTIGLITGVYTCKQVPAHPHVYKTEGEGPYFGFSMSPYDPPEDIWGCGAGCLMVRTAALREWTAPYWAEKVGKNEHNDISIIGHDLYFCERIRNSGYRTVVDGSILCDHLHAASGLAYRLAKNSPPVRRLLRDTRNDTYWSNWWGVAARGQGLKYHNLISKIHSVFNDAKECTFIGSGAGVIWQALANYYNGVDYLVLEDDEQAFGDAHYLPYRTELGSSASKYLVLVDPEDINLNKLEPILRNLNATECTIVIFVPGDSNDWDVLTTGVHDELNSASHIDWNLLMLRLFGKSSSDRQVAEV